MKIEVCCGSYTDAVSAFKGGADRVELCSDLFFGGLTPSLGSLKLLRKDFDKEISVMIRPRESGFCYSEAEFQLMLTDAEEFINNGADGLVFGFLTADGYIDYDKTEKFVKFVNKRCKTVFHKAFDVAKDSAETAVKKLSEIGVTRILTSGKEKNALVGAENLKKMIDMQLLEILPAGSIRIHNIEELQNKTGCDFVHTSAFETLSDKSALNDKINFTSTNLPKQEDYSSVNQVIVENIVNKAHSMK